MKIFKMFLVVALVMSVVVGCATFKRMSTEEKITIAYTTAGESIVAIHTTWKELRTSGKVTDEQNAKFNLLFDKAKSTYLLMGTVEIAVLNATDTISKQSAVAAFNEAANRLPEILLEIQNLINLIKGGK